MIFNVNVYKIAPGESKNTFYYAVGIYSLMSRQLFLSTFSTTWKVQTCAHCNYVESTYTDSDRALALPPLLSCSTWKCKSEERRLPYPGRLSMWARTMHILSLNFGKQKFALKRKENIALTAYLMWPFCSSRSFTTLNSWSYNYLNDPANGPHSLAFQTYMRGYHDMALASGCKWLNLRFYIHTLFLKNQLIPLLDNL